jgi:hypothetical protein
MADDSPPHSAASWKIATALALIYLAWGTTYLAIRVGVNDLPPFLFSGSRISLAGDVLMLAVVIGQMVGEDNFHWPVW